MRELELIEKPVQGHLASRLEPRNHVNPQTIGRDGQFADTPVLARG